MNKQKVLFESDNTKPEDYEKLEPTDYTIEDEPTESEVEEVVLKEPVQEKVCVCGSKNVVREGDKDICDDCGREVIGIDELGEPLVPKHKKVNESADADRVEALRRALRLWNAGQYEKAMALCKKYSITDKQFATALVNSLHESENEEGEELQEAELPKGLTMDAQLKELIRVGLDPADIDVRYSEPKYHSYTGRSNVSRLSIDMNKLKSCGYKRIKTNSEDYTSSLYTNGTWVINIVHSSRGDVSIYKLGAKAKKKIQSGEEFDIYNDSLSESMMNPRVPGHTFKNAGAMWEIIATKGDYTLVYCSTKKISPYVVAWNLESNGSWGQGHYFNDRDSAYRYLKKQPGNLVESSKRIKEDADMEVIEPEEKSNLEKNIIYAVQQPVTTAKKPNIADAVTECDDKLGKAIMEAMFPTAKMKTVEEYGNLVDLEENPPTKKSLNK